MVVKLHKGVHSTQYTIALDDWSFVLAHPAELVLAFLNEDYAGICAEHADHCAQTLSQSGGAPLLRDMIDHVLVCEKERGFDPITRLAVYSFVTDMFDLSRVASFSERVSLDASAAAPEDAAQMTERWTTLLEQKQPKQLCREDLFELLLQDAASADLPFALQFSMEFSSLSQLLKSFVVEMIRTRVLLTRCDCGRYMLAKEQDKCACKA